METGLVELCAMTKVLIREAGDADAEIVGELIDAMDAHYNGAGNTAGVAAAAKLVRATIGEREGTRFLVATLDERPAGIACFAVIRPGHRHQGLVYLKDLFVATEARGAGVGRALLQALARLAIETGIGRIDLNTAHENEPARRLYEGLDGEREDVLRYRWSGAGLRALAADPDSIDGA
jgi:ribosomal protein S18 acetylase RimI-like enzyme